MTYAQSIEFLYGLRLFGLKLGLENTRKLAARAGNPHAELRFIHIAGTNGKGSVAAMLESIYRAAGLRVGLYTSPHLVSFRERIQVNRQMISEAEVVRQVSELREMGGWPVNTSTANTAIAQSRPFNSVPASSEPEPRQDACCTFFEFVTVMALRHFAEQHCDLVIWETGLGGRLDATNIVTPLASVITNIEQDHQRWLGHDFRSIATEKAGIIKPGVPVITSTAEPEALAVIQETALAQASSLTLVTPAHTGHPPLDTIRLPLLGWHQRMNAATALATIQVLQNKIPVGKKATRCGFENVRWPGRLQLIERNRDGIGHQGEFSQQSCDGGAMPKSRRDSVPQRTQFILLDGAHNASGATSLRAVVEEEFGGLATTLILGILEDKDWKLMCEVLAPGAIRIICVPVKSERAADPNKLADACRLTNSTAEIVVMDSVAQALAGTTEASLTIVAGSLYLVGEALEVLNMDPLSNTDEKRLNEWTTSSSC